MVKIDEETRQRWINNVESQSFKIQPLQDHLKLEPKADKSQMLTEMI